MAKNDEITFFGYHAVCLIDVLGQQQKLAHWGNLPHLGQPTPELIQAIKGTVGTVLAFKQQFVELFSSMNSYRNPNVQAALPAQKKEQCERCLQCDVKVERFADSFVFSSRIANSQQDASVAPVYRLLAACCHAMIVSLAAKRPVRGALTVGLGAILEDGSFYGPALAEAHHLESEEAGYPRVIVSPRLWDFLCADLYTHDPEVNRAMNQIAGLCRSLISKDKDGRLMVDYLSPQNHRIFGYSTRIKQVIGLAYEFVTGEADRFKREGIAKLADRYELLAQYFDSSMPTWGISGRRCK